MLPTILVQPDTLAMLRAPAIDHEAATFFREHMNPAFADVSWWLSGPGSELWVTLVLLTAIAYMARRRHWYAMLTLVLTVPCGSLLGQLIKWTVGRQRPFVAGPFGDWGGYSFPSGHTLAATLLYGFFTILLLRVAGRKRWRAATIAGGALLVLGVAFSRVALGAHYVTDVLAGMLLGMSWVMACTLAVAQLRARRTLAAQ